MKRKYLINALIGIGVVTLIGGYFFGLFSKGLKVKSNENFKQVVMDYSGENLLAENEDNKINVGDNDKGDNQTEGFDGGLENVPEQEVDESMLQKSYEEIMGKELAKKTSKLAHDFIKIYYNYNGKEPSKYIEKSKKYMTTILYNELMGDLERPTHFEFTRDFVSADIHESSDFRAEDIDTYVPYIVYVTGKVTDVLGEETKNVTDVFLLILTKVDGDYKVDKIHKNIPFY